MRTRTLRLSGPAVAAALVIGLLAPTPASAATPAGSVSGRLETTAGAPAVGVSVYASGDLDRHPDHVYRATTDSDGRYRFDAVAGDGYDVGVTADRVWVPRIVGSARVAAGGAAAVGTATVTRVAVVRGALVSSPDGSPIAGLRVSTTVRYGDSLSSGAGADVTASDGSFTLYASPADFRLDSATDGWLDVRRPLTLREGEQVDLGAVPAVPSGDVAIDLQGRSGHPILDSQVAVVIDGCRLDPAYRRSCPTGDYRRGHSVLQVATGSHTVRYEVRNPVNATVRRVSKNVVVDHGATTDLGVVRVKADPLRRVAVRPGRYAAAKRVTVEVTPAGYTDDRTPHLRTTFVVNGKRVTPTSVRYRRSADGSSVRLVATLSAAWSTRRELRVRAVVHGTSVSTGQTSAAVTLHRR